MKIVTLNTAVLLGHCYNRTFFRGNELRTFCLLFEKLPKTAFKKRNNSIKIFHYSISKLFIENLRIKNNFFADYVIPLFANKCFLFLYINWISRLEINSKDLISRLIDKELFRWSNLKTQLCWWPRKILRKKVTWKGNEKEIWSKRIHCWILRVNKLANWSYFRNRIHNETEFKFKSWKILYLGFTFCSLWKTKIDNVIKAEVKYVSEIKPKFFYIT